MAYFPRALDKSHPHPLKVLIPLFPDFNTFDANGPIEVLATSNRTASGKQYFQLFVAAETELTKSIEGVSLSRDISFTEALERINEWDIVLLPGGVQASILGMIKTWKDDKSSPENGLINLLDRYLELKDGLTLTVCTGSLFLAELGKLDGRTGTTHWGSLPLIKKMCKEKGSETNIIRARWVDSKEETKPRLIMAGGVSCGIDATFYLLELVAGAQIATTVAERIEYQRRGEEVVQADYFIPELA